VAARTSASIRWDFRRRNLINRGELPFADRQAGAYEGETEVRTRRLSRDFERALAEIGGRRRRRCRPLGRRALSRPRRDTVVERSGSGAKAEGERRVAIERRWIVTVYVGRSVLGKGLERLGAVAADTLRLALDRIPIHAGLDHLTMREVWHLRVAFVVVAARRDGRMHYLLAAIRPPATERPGFEEDDHDEDGVVSAGGNAPICTSSRARGGRQLRHHHPDLQLRAHACQWWRGRRRAPGTWSSRLCGDRGTSGRAINPPYRARPGDRRVGQDCGGVFLESVIYDRDAANPQRLAGGTTCVPMASDFAKRASEHSGAVPVQGQSPLGAKGAVEGGDGGGAATAANAVAAALAPLGVELRELPCRDADLDVLGAKPAGGERSDHWSRAIA